jgi:hypothetical protein
MTKNEALRMAIEWLDNLQLDYSGHSVRKACQDALAETQEPVLYIDGGGLDGHATWAQAIRCQDTDIALYTTPPSREWQSLSDEEIEELYGDCSIEYFRDIEAKLKEKNG